MLLPESFNARLEAAPCGLPKHRVCCFVLDLFYDHTQGKYLMGDNW